MLIGTESFPVSLLYSLYTVFPFVITSVTVTLFNAIFPVFVTVILYPITSPDFTDAVASLPVSGVIGVPFKLYTSLVTFNLGIEFVIVFVVVSTEDFTYQSGTTFSSTVYVISPFSPYLGKSLKLVVQVLFVTLDGLVNVFSIVVAVVPSAYLPLNTIVISCGREPFSSVLFIGSLPLSSHTLLTVIFAYSIAVVSSTGSGVTGLFIVSLETPVTPFDILFSVSLISAVVTMYVAVIVIFLLLSGSSAMVNVVAVPLLLIVTPSVSLNVGILVAVLPFFVIIIVSVTTTFVKSVFPVFVTVIV